MPDNYVVRVTNKILPFTDKDTFPHVNCSIEDAIKLSTEMNNKFLEDGVCQQAIIEFENTENKSLDEVHNLISQEISKLGIPKQSVFNQFGITLNEKSLKPSDQPSLRFPVGEEELIQVIDFVPSTVEGIENYATEHMKEIKSYCDIFSLDYVKTDRGEKIGDIEIVYVKNKNDEFLTFDIVASNMQFPVACGLRLYECARTIALSLAGGEPINSLTVQESLEKERVYSDQIDDCKKKIAELLKKNKPTIKDSYIDFLSDKEQFDSAEHLEHLMRWSGITPNENT